MPRKFFILAWCAGLWFCLLPIAAQETGWARFRGPNGSGVANNQNIPVTFSEDTILWKTPIPGLGNSSPVVYKDLLFLQTSSDSGDQRMLLCINAKSGKQNWSRSIPAQKSKVHPSNTLASSTPVTDGEGVYTAFFDGKDISLVGYTIQGDLLWRKDLGPWVGVLGPGASPMLYKDKLIFLSDMDRLDKDQQPVKRASVLMALDKKSGALLWEVAREADRGCYTTPFIREIPGKAPELIVTSSTAISGVNPDNGKENWRWKWTFLDKPLRTVGASFIADGLLFAFSGDGRGDRQMYAVSMTANGAAGNVWQSSKDFPYIPCCLINGANIYFVNDKGFAGCFDAKTGKKIWMERLPDATFISSPVLIDGNIYAPSEQGDVFVIAAEPVFKVLARNQLGETIRATPAVADGRLFIRDQSHLFCIGKKK